MFYEIISLKHYVRNPKWLMFICDRFNHCYSLVCFNHIHPFNSSFCLSAILNLTSFLTISFFSIYIVSIFVFWFVYLNAFDLPMILIYLSLSCLTVNTSNRDVPSVIKPCLTSYWTRLTFRFPYISTIFWFSQSSLLVLY